MVENAKRSLLVFGLIIMLMLISCISAQAATDFNTDKSIMADRCNTDYGYKDIVSNIKSDKMAKLYKAIDSVEKDFFVNNRNATKLSDSQYCIKTMDVSKYGLSDDQVIQVRLLPPLLSLNVFLSLQMQVIAILNTAKSVTELENMSITVAAIRPITYILLLSCF